MLEKILTTLTIQQVKEFAHDNGWNENILTTTESPNYEIPNPIKAKEYLRSKFNAPILEAYKAFKLKSAKALAEEKVRLAEQELLDATETLSLKELE